VPSANEKVALVTGASRGIGAATAVKLAEAGFDLALNYRSKAARAEKVARTIRDLGRNVLLAQADLTLEHELASMMQLIGETFGRLDLLILNASGGLEKGKPDDYATELNRTAQLRTAQSAVKLMRAGGRIVFVTSHWAHFYGVKPVMPAYEPVAKSKRAGEDALREYAAGLTEKSISFVVVSGDAIDGTITPRLLNRLTAGAMDNRRREGTLPTVDEFAAAICQAAIDQSLAAGHTVFVGSTD